MSAIAVGKRQLMIKQRWEDCTIGFYCPNCNAELVADSHNEEKECDCGLRYSLAVSLKITPPKNASKKKVMDRQQL